MFGTFRLYQAQVLHWMHECFGPRDATDKPMRGHRFLEEALELVQACDITKEEALQLVDYVYGRPAGEPHQEVGGVMVTLAGLCSAIQLDLNECAQREIDRVSRPEIIEKVRIKHANKPKFGPLPGSVAINA
jgi:hypothetical protein